MLNNLKSKKMKKITFSRSTVFHKRASFFCSGEKLQLLLNSILYPDRSVWLKQDFTFLPSLRQISITTQLN